ncbi:MAG TPA: AgmX/PglI C-terminal domain-containing protein, partial [Polyangiaceae bacterium]|nr:AgmX/PglI C-terminal domain-containing protein [Polyangiaceae bacterium]
MHVDHRSRWVRGGALVSVACLLACQPSATLPPHTETPTSTAAAPASAAPATPSVAIATRAEYAPGPLVGPLECVAGADPELDRESPWSKEVGQRLDRVLPRLNACSLGLPAGETAEATLRVVYGADGTPRSQHVVHSTANACPLTDCLTQELGRVPSPKHVLELASYDIALVVERGAVRRATEAPPVLADDEAEDAPVDASCVDPAIAQLSRKKIREIVSTTYKDLKACYSQAIARDRQAAGKVTFEFVIGHSGNVALAQARDATLPDCNAISCMVAEFRELSFPPPVGRSVRVLYPIDYAIDV